jgi:hypothetical protein
MLPLSQDKVLLTMLLRPGLVLLLLLLNTASSETILNGLMLALLSLGG